VPDLKQQITELAELMEEFHLEEAKLSGDDWKISFSKTGPQLTYVASAGHVAAAPAESASPKPAKAPSKKPTAAPTGTPVSSPMMGIYYNTPSPGSPPFVKEGEVVQSGQVVGLIEAMKVFNEIVAPTGGTVSKIVATNGQLVQVNDPLLFIG
jgi:acetyl-CoA carboxylase biotin carboxyl carrier protein